MPEVIINGPEGRIECRYMPAEAPDAPTALILHPEPDRGGTMNNRVTYALYQHCLLYTSPSPRDGLLSRMPSSA